MPRKITAYACEFKCGEKVNTKKHAIELHENICFSNPKRRACRTCDLFEIDEDFSHCHGDHLHPDDKFATFNCVYWRIAE